MIGSREAGPSLAPLSAPTQTMATPEIFLVRLFQQASASCGRRVFIGQRASAPGTQPVTRSFPSRLPGQSLPMGLNPGFARAVQVSARRSPDVGDQVDHDLADLLLREFACLEDTCELNLQNVESTSRGQHAHREQASHGDRERITRPDL